MAAKICVCHHGTRIVYIFTLSIMSILLKRDNKTKKCIILYYIYILEYVNMFYIRKRDRVKERMRIIRICHWKADVWVRVRGSFIQEAADMGIDTTDFLASGSSDDFFSSWPLASKWDEDEFHVIVSMNTMNYSCTNQLLAIRGMFWDLYCIAININT